LPPPKKPILSICRVFLKMLRKSRDDHHTASIIGKIANSKSR
jgi:hypothetical protein